MLNNVVLIGRLARDPEMRYTPQGKPVGGFVLAVDRPFPNQQGEREADFLDVVVWGKLAETCANHLSKGRLVAVSGRIQTSSYQDKAGNRRKAVEVVAETVRFLDRPQAAQPEEEVGDEEAPF